MVLATAALCVSVTASAGQVPAVRSAGAAPTLAPINSSAFVPAPSDQAPCPEGDSRSSTVYAQSFNSIPEARYNSGFSSQPGGTKGARSARSLLSVSAIDEFMFLPYERVPVGARTMLGFTTRGTGDTQARVAVNSVRSSFETTSRWAGVSVDITRATRDEGGWLSTYFEHRGRSGTSSSLSIDQAEIYRCRDNATQRVAGSDRYATAAQLSQRIAPGVSTVFVATGTGFPDALSAAARAGSTDVPLLLVRGDRIPEATASALQRLDPDRIVVVGGERVVGRDVLRRLRSFAPVVDRVSGDNRYKTSAKLSELFDPGVRTAFVATGNNFPDALSGGALAADRGGPMLLTEKAGLPSPIRTELRRLKPQRIVVLGGPRVVSNTVMDQLGRYASGGRSAVRRIDGDDRYETSANVAKEFSSPRRSYLATGGTFADAIVGGAAAGSQGAPLLLTRTDDLPDAVNTRLRAIGEASGVVLGGPRSVAPIARDQYGRTLP